MLSCVQYEEQLAQLNADIKGDARALRISNQVVHLPQRFCWAPLPFCWMYVQCPLYSNVHHHWLEKFCAQSELIMCRVLHGLWVH